MRRITLAVVGTLLAGCATAGNQSPDVQRQAFRATDNPCSGKGELFHFGQADHRLPQNATVVREVTHRGTASVCYTTPESLRAAG